MKFVAAFVVLSLAALGPADSLKKTAHEASDKGGAALAHGDTASFAKVMKPYVTDDFKFTEPGQSMDFKGMIAHLKTGIAMMGHVTGATSTVVNCLEHGNTGIVNAKHGMTAVLTGPDHKSHKMVVAGTSRDTWVKVKGKWKLSGMHWMGDSMTMDGKSLSSK